MRPIGASDGPVGVAYDGSPASEMALIETAALVTPREAVIVTVWKEGIGLRAIEPPEHLPPAPLDVRVAGEVDQAMAERAQRLAEHGALVAREAGLDAIGLAVAEEIDVPVSETIVDVAKRRRAAAIALG